MNRTQADIVAGVLIGSILLLGVVSAIQLQLSDGGMSGGMESSPVMAFVGPILMSLVMASIVGGIYVFVRGQLFATRPGETSETDVGRESDGTADSGDGDGEATERTSGTQPHETGRTREVLEVLPDDERRILEPVIESPGLTQTKVRDRSDFSRSKVSQTITDLEERGLLYREPQGRTYRVYPADDLDERV